jgi:putative ABC transport system permease protein
MFRNYIKIAWRNLIRRKAYTAINISGLAIGIAACLLLFIVVRYEMSYDTFLPDSNNIYHIATKDQTGENIEYVTGIPYPALEALRTDIPDVTTGSLYSSYGSQVTVLGTNSASSGSAKKFIEEIGYFYADPQFFQVFKYKWLLGSPAVLQEPNTTVLTKKMAEKYFGDWQRAVGQFLKLDNVFTTKVAGILDDVPGNTDFPLGLVTSLETYKAHPDFENVDDWGRTSSDFQLFMLLPPSVSANNINQQLAAFSKKHYNKGSTVRQSFIRPLKEVHFDNRYSNFGDHITNKSTLITLSLIGIFIILMACINFINLSTAQAVDRSKEVGVRKVLGSNRRQLFWQIIGETSIIVLIAAIVAVIIAQFTMPYIKYIVSIQEALPLFTWQTLGFVLVGMFIIVILSGTYPSLVISRFNPALALKNKITSATVAGIPLRRALVVMQFAISQVLIIGTIVAVSQMNFVKTADLGFNKEAILIVNSTLDSNTIARQQQLKQRLLQVPGIQNVSFSSDVPSSDNNSSTNFSYNHQPDEDFDLFFKMADENYFNTYGLELVAGRVYAKSDTINEVVINETLLKKLNIATPEAALGNVIRMGTRPWRTIVGVVKDFKVNSLREEIRPLLIASRKASYDCAGIKFKTENLTAIQTAIQKIWNEVNPEYAYTSSFMDENINDFYRQEQQLSLLYKIFAGIAIFISCLGLYGLVSFMAVQRRKEVGVRKVLGASVWNIVYLFSKEFTLLILVAFVLAVPVAYYMMSNWLNNFVYRVDIGIGVFVLAILASILVAWATVGYKSIKTALTSPVKNLRTE